MDEHLPAGWRERDLQLEGRSKAQRQAGGEEQVSCSSLAAGDDLGRGGVHIRSKQRTLTTNGC
jgi:hypothetical protein